MEFFIFRKSARLFCLLLFSLALVIGGCGGGGDSPTTTTVTPTVPVVTTGTIKIANNTGQTINNVYISSTSATTWGTDQISSSISNAGSRDITTILAGSYDVKVVLADSSIKYQYGVSVSAGSTTTVTFVATVVTTGSIKIANSTGQSINYAYVSPASSSTWGVDQLGSSTIASGSNFTLTNITAGSYDVKVVLADGSIKYQYGVGVSAGYITTVTFVATVVTTGSIKIANSTGQSINYAYVSPASSSTWGVDQLGSSTIASGSNFTLTNITAGSYDVKVVLADGSIKYQYGVSVSAGYITTVTFVTTVVTTGSLKISNLSGKTINYAYLSLASSSAWGVDQLGSSTIASGSNYTLTSIPPGTYDFKAILADGTSRYSYGFIISAGSTRTVNVNP